MNLAEAMAQRDFWQLRVGFPGGSEMYIGGAEEVLQRGYDEIIEAIGACDGTAAKIVQVSGIAPTMDRPAATLAVKVEDVIYVELREY